MYKQSLNINWFIRNLFFAIVFALNISIVWAQPYRETLNVQLPSSLSLVNIDGKPTTYYELYLTNFSTDTFKIKKLSIVNIDASFIYLTIQNQELQNRFSRIGSDRSDTTMWLTPGSTSVIYVELFLPKKTITEITHLITFEVTGQESLGELKIQTTATKCPSNTQLVLGAPLQDGTWTAVYDPSWQRGHRRVIYTLNGKARIPGRYAIDFIKIDSDGKYANGDENIIRNWLGYGVDVLAVADGVVSSVRDDFSESPTSSEHPEYSADKATGNYISIKIGDNQFAFYEHLKHNSIKVKVGQKVKKGDVIASLGYTGQTTGPHLHFHVADTDSPLGAEGIAFVFEQFEFLGSYEDFGKFGKTTWTQINDLKQLNRNEERPKPNAVIKFRLD